MDGAAFLDLSEDDVKMMVKPLGHVKRVLRLVSSIKAKVINKCNFVDVYYRLVHVREGYSAHFVCVCGKFFYIAHAYIC